MSAQTESHRPGSGNPARRPSVQQARQNRQELSRKIPSVPPGVVRFPPTSGRLGERCETLPLILQRDESFDIGSDTLTGVNDADYTPPFALTAQFNRLTLKVDRPQLSPADIRKLEAATRNNSSSE